jgi:hypothetical protein
MGVFCDMDAILPALTRIGHVHLKVGDLGLPDLLELINEAR